MGVLDGNLQRQLLDVGLSDTDLPTDPDAWLSFLEQISASYREARHVEETLRRNQTDFLRHYAAAERQAQELALLSQVRTALARRLDLPGLCRNIVEGTAEAFGFKLVALYLVEGDQLILQHQVGYEIAVERIAVQQGIMGRVVRTLQPILVEDVRYDPDFYAPVDGVTSEIAVPLFDHGELIGVFNIQSKDGFILTEDELELIVSLSQHINAALESARLYKTVRESQEQYQRVVDNVREVIFQTDIQGRWTFLNRTWTDLSGYGIDHSLGKDLANFLQFDEPSDHWLQITQRLMGGESHVRYRAHIHCRNGERLPVELLVQLIHAPDGLTLGATGTITDIRERLQAERQAIELMLKSQTLTGLRSFLNLVSHDLRTPLSVMSTSLYLLRRKMNPEPDSLRYLENLEQQVAHLTRAVEDMLDMSHLDEEDVMFDFLRINFNSLVHDSLASLERLASAKNHRLRFERLADPIMIRADQVMLGKVIRNVVNNAIQYTPAGGDIAVQTTIEGDQAVLTVADTGIGISLDDLSRIFERFFKVDKARTASDSGIGLGLPIAKRIVETHNGTIAAASTPGVGSLFTVRLPLCVSSSAGVPGQVQVSDVSPSDLGGQR